MTTRDDILSFLRDPATFAATAADRDLWTEGLDGFSSSACNGETAALKIADAPMLKPMHREGKHDVQSSPIRLNLK